MREIQYSTRTELVHGLESHFNLISVIVHELTRYKSSVLSQSHHEMTKELNELS